MKSPERELRLDSSKRRRSAASGAWNLLANSRLAIACSTSLAIFEGLSEAAILTMFARSALAVVDGESSVVYVPGLGERSFSMAMGFLGVLVLARVVAGVANNWLATKVQYSIVKRTRLQVIDSYTSSPWASQSRLDDGALQQLVLTLPNGISNQLSGLITNFGQLLIMVAMITYAAFTDFVLTTGLMVAILAATLLFRPLRSWIKRRSAQALAEQRNLSSMTAEASALKFEANAFGVGERIAIPLRDAVRRESEHQERVGRLKGSIVPLYTFISYSAMIGGIAVLRWTNPDNLAQTGPILLVVLRSLSYGASVQHAAAGLSSLAPSLELLHERINGLSKWTNSWGAKSINSLESIAFKRVSFTYESEASAALSETSFEIPSGSRLGLVGPSGSGKSTFVKLMLGLVVPTSGEVLVNGQNLRSYSQESWCDGIGIVPQSSMMLRGSVADNVRFYRDGISDEDLWKALEFADLAGEVEDMSDGLNTMLGPGMRTLSGGQQQRLAIARALVKRPSLVIMDEPTSSIDSTSEMQIARSIERLPGETTIVVVSHRVQLLHNFDQIFVFERSRVIASGPPELAEEWTRTQSDEPDLRKR